jgi:4-O-beta-D-mannosyl-D-glucose phosphorylase
MHVAVSSIEKLLDYMMNTPEDGFTSDASLHTVSNIIEKNEQNTKPAEEQKIETSFQV